MRHPRFAVSIAALAIAGCGAASALGAAPTVTSFQVHQPTDHPESLVAVARVSMRGVVTREGSYNAAGRLRRIGATLVLSANGTTARSTDTVRLKHLAHRGDTALLHFRFPEAAARRLDGATDVRADLRVGLLGARQVRVRVAGVPAKGAREAQFNPGAAGCFDMFLCATVRRTPGPAAPVALSGTVRGTTANMCVFYAGPDREGPYVEAVGFEGAQVGNTVTTGWMVFADIGSDFVITDGAYSGDAWVQPLPWTRDDYTTVISGTVSPEAIAGEAGTATATYAGDPAGKLARPVTLATTAQGAFNC